MDISRRKILFGISTVAAIGVLPKPVLALTESLQNIPELKPVAGLNRGLVDLDNLNMRILLKRLEDIHNNWYDASYGGTPSFWLLEPLRNEFGSLLETSRNHRTIENYSVIADGRNNTKDMFDNGGYQIDTYIQRNKTLGEPFIYFSIKCESNITLQDLVNG